jgi:hypothetical protein
MELVYKISRRNPTNNWLNCLKFKLKRFFLPPVINNEVVNQSSKRKIITYLGFGIG